MKSQWSNFHQIGRNSFLAASTVYVSSEFNFVNTSLLNRRSFCFAEGDRSSFVVLKSEAEFNSALSKARDGSLPSVFYFTAAWCGPCRLISPVILELSNKYPDVTTYKVDIDEVCLRLYIYHHWHGFYRSLQVSSCDRIHHCLWFFFCG
ncbi:Thioredoxin domain [Arabidopsis suecica]|uniref:Thioredoxin domain n=1 Tax=Arabidopsis suecica TaxID=45249 RepID=A0A8T2CEQ1_ARASU|nr:Thioredoxin domain [Arabidopsis suecica]